MNKGIADIEIIHKVLSEYTAKRISDGTGIGLSSVKKLKSGERSVEKMNLAVAIKLTEFTRQHTTAEINIWK